MTRRLAPPIVHEILRAPGQPLDETTRALMGSRFSHNFSSVPIHGEQALDNAGLVVNTPADPEEQEAKQAEDSTSSAISIAAKPSLGALQDVRIHADGRAAEAARAVGARAYTVGHDVVFASGQYAPTTLEGRSLLAHELVHVSQQQPGVLARKVVAGYATIEDNLTYGFLDWAITDREAHDVLTILSGLSATDFGDTVRKMETDSLVDRLIENIPDADRAANGALIQRIQQQRGSGAIAGQIERLLSYGLLDWVITDNEAHMALEALKSLESDPAKLRDVVVAIPAKQYERFYDNLSSEDRSANLRFLQDIEIMRRSGKTLEQLGAAQRTHLEAQAAAAGVSVGEHIRGEAAARGYGGNTATWWPSLTPAEKADWTTRFDTVVTRIRTTAPEEVRKIIQSAETAGGGIRFEPELIEELGAYAVNHGTVLGVGKSWLLAAEDNPENVLENIVHELGGHHEFGATASWDIMKRTLGSIPPGERTIAESGDRNPYTAYGYMETEIYAELRELPYRREGSQGDDPVQDVRRQLMKLKAAFAPNVAEPIVRGFRRRIQIDRLISDEARSLFDAAANEVFGITF
jgi:hypothetical protein